MIPLPIPLRRAVQSAFLAAAMAATPVHAIDLPGAAPAAPNPLPAYADQRTASFLMRNPGLRMSAVDLKRLDECLGAIRIHAGNRPVRFASPDEAARARRDALRIAVTLAEITKQDATQPRLLLRAALALSLADNLGAPPAGELAEARFTALLDKLPDNAEALFEYGVFLTNRGRPTDALPRLERALASGEERARWPLALALAALDRSAAAQAQLETLQTRSARIASDYPLTETLTALRAAPITKP